MPTGTCSWHTANDLSFPPGAITNQRASAIHLQAATIEKEAPPHLKELITTLRSDEMKSTQHGIRESTSAFANLLGTREVSSGVNQRMLVLSN